MFRGAPPLQRTASVIIPFGGGHDYLGRLSNCIRSVRWQKQVRNRNIEVILVCLRRESAEESPDEMDRLDELVKSNDIQIIELRKEYEHFPLCLARNIGARKAQGETLVFIDADTVLDPEFLARSLRRRGKLVTCWFSYLPEGHPSITDYTCVRKFAPQGRILRAAYGGGIVAPRKAVMAIRGFDETYDRAWGADDNDMVDRLIGHGLEWYNITMLERIVNLHQYHPSAVDEDAPGTVANRERYYKLNTVVRNEENWGEP
jgi:glycosyltransferase involved in cell wall biosynthesis